MLTSSKDEVKLLSDMEIKEALAASPLLHDCGIGTEDIRVRHCKKGQILSDRRRGQEILGLIAGGGVDVYSIAMDGREVLLSQLKRGDCFGIVNLFTDTELPTVLKCRSAATVLMIPKTSFLEAMQKNRELSLRYAGICNRKMQFLLRRIEFLTMQSVRKKLIQLLLSLEEEKDTVTLPVSKESLAAVLGTSRASLFREFAKLQEEGLIFQEEKRICLLEKRQLEEILYECR